MNLQRAATFAMIVICLAVTGSLAHSYYRTLLRPARPLQAPNRVGEHIADISDLGFDETLSQQLGLRLVAKRVTVQIPIIDHAEPPSPN
jgi:uncharacterized protein (TIGR03435 family)